MRLTKGRRGKRSALAARLPREGPPELINTECKADGEGAVPTLKVGDRGAEPADVTLSVC